MKNVFQAKSKFYRIIQRQFTLLMVAVFCFGCGQPQGELFENTISGLVWPEPPDKPRIQYLGELSSQDDLKPAISWLEASKRALFGRDKIGVLLAPYAIALDDDERLFVADPAGSVIHIMDLQTRYYQQFSQLNETETLLYPVGLTIVGGNLFVADSKLARICVFDKKGNFLFSFGEDNLKRPTGIAYGANNKKIYVADTARHTIFVFDEEGRCDFEIGSRGPDFGQFNFPTQLWVDNVGKLYVSDTLNYRVQIFSENGDFYQVFGQQGDRPGNFAHPCGIAVDHMGNIYVADRQFENIQVFNPEGHILMAFGQEGTGPGQFWLPGAILIDKKNRIFVSDSYNKRVQVFQILEQK